MKKTKTNPIFCERLKAALEKQNCSQAKLAKLIGGVPSQITNYLHGDVYPTETTLYKLSSALCVSYDWLIGRTDVCDTYNSQSYKQQIEKLLNEIEENAINKGRAEAQKKYSALIIKLFEQGKESELYRLAMDSKKLDDYYRKYKIT